MVRNEFLILNHATRDSFYSISKQIEYTVLPCQFGFILIGMTAHGVCSIRFGDHEEFLKKGLQELFPFAVLKRLATTSQHKWIEEILHYLETPNKAITVSLDIKGTAFQMDVWNALCQIPVGKTNSYTDIAVRIGKPKAFRAVANACGQNPVAFIIPCHRVLRSNGELGGYRWGVERKQKILKHEADWIKNRI